MRLGRLILLAGLAPLLTLSAIAAGAPQSGDTEQKPVNLARLLRSVALLAVSDTEGSSISVSAHPQYPQAVLALEALAHTPLGHSLWMVERLSSISVIVRPTRPLQLRC
jgi:hypothetical protein